VAGVQQVRDAGKAQSVAESGYASAQIQTNEYPSYVKYNCLYHNEDKDTKKEIPASEFHNWLRDL
jgi:hypothetical protein